MSETIGFSLRAAATGSIVASRVAVASSVWRRFMGLMGRSGLAPDEGLWLPGDRSIHMLFMRFPIDAVFVAPGMEPGTWRIVEIRSALPPWRGVVWPVRGAAGCLELAAGRAAEAGLTLGDTVRLEPA